ncbi:MAG: dihydropteroate synthase [Nitrospirae bacterium]|nr:dihydropteroate synthase [Nitrospirota bacterium]
MIVIAENLNTRNTAYMEAIKEFDPETIKRLSGELVNAGADVVNIQCSLDGSGDEEILPKVVDVVVQSHDPIICIDTRNFDALKRAIPFCKKPPIINYLSLEEQNPEDILTLCRNNQCWLIIRALRGIIPTSLEGKLQVLEELIEMANAADIPNVRLFADPSVVHIGRGMGQEHMVSSHECILALKEMVDPPINTIAWISNVSTGLHKKLKPIVNASFLTYMAGAGLDAAIVDVLDPEVMRAVYLVRSFRDEIIFSQADLEGAA